MAKNGVHESDAQPPDDGRRRRATTQVTVTLHFEGAAAVVLIDKARRSRAHDHSVEGFIRRMVARDIAEDVEDLLHEERLQSARVAARRKRAQTKQKRKKKADRRRRKQAVASGRAKDHTEHTWAKTAQGEPSEGADKVVLVPAP